MIHSPRGEFRRMPATPLRDSAFLAKITRPGFTQVLRRERLFRRLDASREPVLWVSAPPGAGKPTLASSYLVERDLAHLWYQLDARDARSEERRVGKESREGCAVA